jgi:hypothetical protein
MRPIAPLVRPCFVVLSCRSTIGSRSVLNRMITGSSQLS